MAKKVTGIKKKAAPPKKAAKKAVKKAGAKRAPAKRAAVRRALPAPAVPFTAPFNKILGFPTVQTIAIDAGMNVTSPGTALGTVSQPKQGVLHLALATSKLQFFQADDGQPTTMRMTAASGSVPATGAAPVDVTATVVQTAPGVFEVQIRPR